MQTERSRRRRRTRGGREDDRLDVRAPLYARTMLGAAPTAARSLASSRHRRDTLRLRRRSWAPSTSLKEDEFCTHPRRASTRRPTTPHRSITWSRARGGRRWSIVERPRRTWRRERRAPTADGERARGGAAHDAESSVLVLAGRGGQKRRSRPAGAATPPAYLSGVGMLSSSISGRYTLALACAEKMMRWRSKGRSRPSCTRCSATCSRLRRPIRFFVWISCVVDRGSRMRSP